MSSKRTSSLIRLDRDSRRHSSALCMSDKPYVAFFDLDETLLSVNSGRVFWDYCLKRGIYSGQEIGFITFSLIKFLAGFDETEDFIRNWASCFKGWSEARMLELTNELFDLHIRDLIRHDARREIEHHRKQGALTVILSASTDYVCEPVRKELQMDKVLCSRLETANGQFTGRLGSPYVFGEQKLLAALQFADDNGIDLQKCYYYGDAHTDRFVMGAVGTPVCVTPDKKLRAYALEKNWRIVEW